VNLSVPIVTGNELRNVVKTEEITRPENRGIAMAQKPIVSAATSTQRKIHIVVQTAIETVGYAGNFENPQFSLAETPQTCYNEDTTRKWSDFFSRP